MWAACLGKYFPVGGWRKSFKEVSLVLGPHLVLRTPQQPEFLIAISRNLASCNFSQLPPVLGFSGGGEWLVIIPRWPFRDSGTQFWPGHPPCSGCDHHVSLWAERAETDRQTYR